MNILLVESDHDLVAVVEYALGRQGYCVIVASELGEVRERLTTGLLDLIIIGISVLTSDGCGFIAALRRDSEVPVVVISADHDERAMVRSLESGADNYVVWPFDLRELVLRVQRLLCVHPKPEPLGDYQPHLSVGDLVIDMAGFRAFKNGVALKLTRVEMRLLSCLVESSGTWVEVQKLLDSAGQSRPAGRTSHVKTHISHLRRKLHEAGGKGFRIRAEPRGGYVLSI